MLFTPLTSYRQYFIRVFIICFFAVASISNAHAQGDLLISPLRLVFDGAKKSQEISLANVGKDTATYAISIVNMRMNENGSFETITEPDSGQNFANKFVRFFPRRVVLAPNEAQVVKVQLMRTSQMEAGEYRSHMYFRAVPDEKPLGLGDKKKDTAGISIQLKPIFGITIPVIIRSGEYTTDVTLTDLRLTAEEDKKAILHLTFNRQGNMSIYGDLNIEYIPVKGKSFEVKFVKGIGVYTPIPKRMFSVELDENKDFDPHSGKLKIKYSIQTNEKDPKVKEAILELN